MLSHMVLLDLTEAALAFTHDITQSRILAADARVDAARKALAESCGHDIDRLFAEARERQRKSGRPSVNLQKQNKEHAV